MPNDSATASERRPVGRLFTPPEAARLLRRSVSTLAQWRCRGVGPGYVILEGRVLYPAIALSRFVKAGAIDPESPRPVEVAG